MNEQEKKQKTAAFADAAKQLGSAAGQAIGSAAVTGTMALAGVAAARLYDAATKSRDYRAMLSHNSDLHEFAKENPNKANSLYTSLRQINPDFSKDPFVAGHFMRQMANDPGREGGYLLMAAQERGRFEEPVLDSYLKGGVEGAKPRSGQSLPWGASPGSGQQGRGGGGPLRGGAPSPPVA